jgi:tetratricopeptide (TPR) repeat protein
MTPERWRQIHDVFEQALGRPAGERHLFLDRACGGDAALASELADLLAHDARALAADFLAANCPAALQSGPPFASGEEPAAGRRIGPYEVQQHVAGGGMGDVYRAVRVDDYRQTVAIKVIKHGLASTEIRERFRIERQVLARLSHPNVVRLLDGGTMADGRPYFDMEFIDGQSLDRYCARRQSALRERLLLLLAVARAVHYAHQQGVIHRDLKPGNVLVTADGVPKINDFGLAKPLDPPADPCGASSHTRAGVILGSPNYLAPEQAGGPSEGMGPHTDVYALGAILYELLTGRPPFQGATLLETLEQVRSVEPVPPSRCSGHVPRDVETVCLKALAKSPAGRYPTAAAFAADLERFLQGRPVEARPVGRLVRAGRWARRQPVTAGLLALLALAVAAGFGAVTWQWRRAEENFAEANRQHLRADQSYRQAHQAVNDLVTISSGDLLSGQPSMEPVCLALAEEAVRYYQDLLRQRGDDPDLQADLAAEYLRVAHLYCSDVGQRQRASAAYEQALSLGEDLLQKHPDVPAFHRLYGHIQLGLGKFQLDSGHKAEAGPFLEQGITFLAQYVAARPDDLEARTDLASGYYGLGLLRHDSGRPDEALEWHHEARVLAEEVVRANPRGVPCRVVLARVLYHVARAQAETEHSDEALRAYQDSVALWKQLADEKPLQAAFRRDLAACYHNAGNLRRDAGALADAVSFYRQALPIREKLSCDNPDHLAFLSDAAGTGYNLGQVLQRQGRREEAVAALQRSLDQTCELCKKAPSDVGYGRRLGECRRELAQLYRDLGQSDRAAALSQQPAGRKPLPERLTGR